MPASASAVWGSIPRAIWLPASAAAPWRACSQRFFFHFRSGFGKSIPDTLETNFYGTKRVSEAFLPLLDPEEGRICNVASASGPNFVRGLDDAGTELFTSRSTTWEALKAELDKYAAVSDYEGVAYGLSKAAVNVWTMQLAAAHPKLKINSCSPGYILTDLTRGMGATKKPEESNCVRRRCSRSLCWICDVLLPAAILLCMPVACHRRSPYHTHRIEICSPQHVAPLFLLFGDVPTPATNFGRYYGSDAVRSPIDRYRGPGDPPYEGD